MIKLLVFIQKLPSISSDDFRTYYETHHVPLINSLLPMYAGYKRNYLHHSTIANGAERLWDVVTELFFANEADYARWIDALSDPNIIARIREDEAQFLLSSATQIWTVYETGTQP